MLIFLNIQGHRVLLQDCNCTKGIEQVLVMWFSSWTWINSSDLIGVHSDYLLDIFKRQESRCCSIWLQEDCSQTSEDRADFPCTWGQSPDTSISDVMLLKGCKSLNFSCSLWSKSLWPKWWGWIQLTGCFRLVLLCPKCRNRNWTSRGNLNCCMMPCGCSEPDCRAEGGVGGGGGEY